MHILCPHCRNPIELVNLTPEEILCPACGSSFRLETPSTAAWTPADGERKLGRFVLLDAVGVGAFGTVYKARDPELDRTVAIKVPRADNLPDRGDAERFLREARSLANLRHASIVPSCLVMDGGPSGDFNRALQKELRFPISGYANSVDWAASALIEFTYFDMDSESAEIACYQENHDHKSTEPNLSIMRRLNDSHLDDVSFLPLVPSPPGHPAFGESPPPALGNSRQHKTAALPFGQGTSILHSLPSCSEAFLQPTLLHRTRPT